MASKSDSNDPRVVDDMSQPMRSFGCDCSDLKRLEEASRLMQQLEWKLARRWSRPTGTDRTDLND